jgi:hypothetical protein
LTTLESFDNASFANPFFVPSLSMEVNRISLPLFVPLLPNQINLTLVFLFPTKWTIHRPSIGINRDNHTLTAKFLCQIIDQLGFTEELIETLSAPFWSKIYIGYGRNSAYRKWNINCRSHFRTKSTKVFLLSSVAEISKH